MKRGLHERVIDLALARVLRELRDQHEHESLDVGDSHAVLARHLAGLIEASLRRQPAKSRRDSQVALVNDLIATLARHDKSIDPVATQLPADLRRLLSIYYDTKPARPDTPASQTSLLTGTRVDPSLISQLKQELASANRVDFRRLVHSGFVSALPMRSSWHGSSINTVYRRDTWRGLCTSAGVAEAYDAPDDTLIRVWLRRIAHVDDGVRLTAWRDWLANGGPGNALTLCLLAPLLDSREELTAAAHVWQLLRRKAALHADALSRAQCLAIFAIDLFGAIIMNMNHLDQAGWANEHEYPQ